jgi:exo-beta-1,3-glucanase (GH17 family)
MALLDTAYANGVTVSLCLSLRSERHGFDYSDPVAVAEQLEWVRQEVEKYRNHPALLTWIIGNELNHSYTNPAVYDAVDEIARFIAESDPYHPTTTTLAEPDAAVLAEVQERAPNLDFISVQAYGALFGLPQVLAEAGFDAPLMVTEWGTVGYWEMKRTAWDIPHETTSTEKAELFRRALHEVMPQMDRQLIGSYVFLWGQKQERTPTWFGLFTEAGEETEAVDILHHAWTGEWPDNRSPQVHEVLLNGGSYADDVVLIAGQHYQASVDVSDPDGDELRYHWEVKPESDSQNAGGDREQPIPNIEGLIQNNTSASIQVVAPGPGNYRLFVYAYDDQGHAAHANIPFQVAEEFKQPVSALLADEAMAVAYSGFRLGQHPDRGEGANSPSEAEVLEDLHILLEHDLKLIRLYDSQENSITTLELIRQHNLPIKVLLGAWLKAEISNHEGCDWLDEPIPDAELVMNTLDNAAEVRKVIKLASEYSDIVVAINVGNEALVEWNDHMVPVGKMKTYLQQVRAAVEQPVTTADNYEWGSRDGSEIAGDVDFLGVHTYPVWEYKSIDEALAFTIENIQQVRAAIPDKPIAILEAGWATTAGEFGDRASEANQTRYFKELGDWARRSNTTVFFFEAFDEPWKGSEHDPLNAEKHWGLFFVDRTPKEVMAD